VKLSFLNNNPDPNDQLHIVKQQGKENCMECCSSEEQDFHGALDTSFYCVNDGNTIYSYLFWVIGTSNSGIKSINTIPFDTVEINLVY
jgi:hypothetical protein